MKTAKYFLYGALGVAVVLLLTSDKAKAVRDDLEDKAKENANKWKGKLWNMAGNAKGTLSELRELLNSEIEGLSDDARARIEKIVNKTARSADGIKRNVANNLS